MYDSFFISNDFKNEYFSEKDLEEINAAFDTKEPLVTLNSGIGDVEGFQLLIEVGVGLISALTYDMLKGVVTKLVSSVKRKHLENASEQFSPDVNFIVDAEAVNIRFNIKIDCMASEGEIEKSVKEMQKLAKTIVEDNKGIDFSTEVL